MSTHLYLALLSLLVAQQVESKAEVIPRIAMPDRVYRVLRQALEAVPNRSAAELKQNVAALDLLRQVPWPDLAKLERVHLYDATKPKEFFNAWRFPAPGGDAVVLPADYQERRLPLAGFSRIEVFHYADELTELVQYLKGRDPERRRAWNFTHLFGEGLPYHGGVFLLNHAYAAAFLGHQKEAAFLVHEALKQRSSAFEQAYDEAAWQSFYRGIALLEKGAARAEVLAHWTGTLKVYANSRYRDQLVELVGELRKQVDEDKKLAAAAVKDPERLPLQERIAYYLARLPDVHGQQWSQPGHCQTVGLGKGTEISDAVVKIGRPAVPALIEHLTDTRVTRSIGFQRSFYPHRVVLRVQDVAVQCIEAILDIRFYHSSSTSSYLSNESAEKRDKVIADIKAWWKENGHKTPLEGFQARLDKGHLWDKLATLEKIEAIDKKAIDAVAVLKRWAAEVSPERLGEVAEELARRGDLSLLPAVRQLVRDGVQPSKCNDLNQAIWFLLRHGTTADFRFLREEARKDLAAGAQPARVFGPMQSGVASSDRPIAVPLLVDFLDQRKITGARYVSEEKGSVGFSCADSCMGTLIRLTGHNEGYDPGATDKERYAAIDRWLAWWHREGEAAYVKKHPEVRAVLGASR